MNCWPSGKYVNLLYMYSILGRGSFCFNYCLSSAWHGGDQFVALLRWYERPGFFDSGLQLICIFGLLFLIFLLTIPHRFSMGFRSGEFAGQSSTPTQWSFNQTFGVFGSVGRCQIMLENEISIFKKLVSRRKHEVLQNVLVNGCSDLLVFKKHNGPTPADDIATPNHHRLWKLNTGLQATWAMSFSTLPPDSRTLKRGLWTTGQQSSSSSP